MRLFIKLFNYLLNYLNDNIVTIIVTIAKRGGNNSFIARKIYLLAIDRSMRAKSKRRSPALRRLIRFADFFGLATRKAIKALAGDYSVEILRLRRERRHAMARWNIALAWGYAFWYAFRTPIDRLVAYLIKSFRGPG